MTTKQPPAQKHLEEKDSAAFEKWFVEHFANGKGTFFYSMKESFQFALEYARQEISPDINELVISNDISTQPKDSSFEELKWKLQREGNCSFPPEWLGIFKMFYDAGKASAIALRIEGPSDEAIDNEASKRRIPKCIETFAEACEWYRSQLKLTHESANVNLEAESNVQKSVCNESAPTSEGLAVTSSKSHTVTSSKTEPAVLVLPKEMQCNLSMNNAEYIGIQYAEGFNEALAEIRRLNPSLKVSVGDE